MDDTRDVSTDHASMDARMDVRIEAGIDAPLYACVGRQLEGPLHGALVPLQQAPSDSPPAPYDAQRANRRLRRLTVAMATVALLSVVALGAQLVRAAGRAADGSTTAQHQQDVGAGLATADHAVARGPSSPAADAHVR
jgi:hypothetical protein